MTCKDCIYLPVCRQRSSSDIINCENFSDRRFWAKFPCLTGTTVYFVYYEISGKRNIAVGTVERFRVYGDNYIDAYVFYEDGRSYWHSSTEFGKIVFFTYEEAKRELKEREEAEQKLKEDER